MSDRRTDQHTRDRIDSLSAFLRFGVIALTVLFVLQLAVVSTVIALYVAQVHSQQHQRRQSLHVACEARNAQDRAIRQIVPKGVPVPTEIQQQNCDAYAKRYAP